MNFLVPHSLPETANASCVGLSGAYWLTVHIGHAYNGAAYTKRPARTFVRGAGTAKNATHIMNIGRSF